MNEYLKQLLQDKNGQYCVRDIATTLFVLVLMISWIAEQFFGMKIPEFMFYGFAGLVSLGCYHYSIERKTSVDTNVNNL